MLSESVKISMLAVRDRFIALYRNAFGENKGDHKLAQHLFLQGVILYRPLFSTTTIGYRCVSARSKAHWYSRERCPFVLTKVALEIAQKRNLVAVGSDKRQLSVKLRTVLFLTCPYIPVGIILPLFRLNFCKHDQPRGLVVRVCDY